MEKKKRGDTRCLTLVEATEKDWEGILALKNEDIVVNMDGGVGGSWEVKSASDFETVWREMEKLNH